MKMIEVLLFPIRKLLDLAFGIPIVLFKVILILSHVVLSLLSFVTYILHTAITTTLLGIKELFNFIHSKATGRRRRAKFSKSSSQLNVMLKARSDNISVNPLVLVMDLDETLVHSTWEKPSFFDTNYASLQTADGITFYVYKRPCMEEFLFQAARYYEIVLFTASQQDYADQIIEYIDPNHYISRRYYRNSCVRDEDGYVKDLRVLRKDMARVVAIDDSPIAYKLTPNNAVRIRPWKNDKKEDDSLLQCLKIIDDVRFSQDVRKDLKPYSANKVCIGE